jgi:hypothetical protein
MLKKGTKFKNGYSKVTKDCGGVDYRNISKILKTQYDIDVAHTSCRNYTIQALEKVALNLIKSLGDVTDGMKLDHREVAKSPIFQNEFGKFIKHFEQ